MYSTVGFVVFLTACLPYATALKVALAIPSTVFCLWLSLLTTCKDDDPDEPMSLPTGHFSINTSFFRTRYDFINRGFELTGQSIYKFKLLRVTILIMPPARPRLNLELAENCRRRFRCTREGRFVQLQRPRPDCGLQGSLWRCTDPSASLAAFLTACSKIPMLPGVTTDLDPKQTATIHRRLATAQNSDHLERCMFYSAAGLHALTHSR